MESCHRLDNLVAVRTSPHPTLPQRHLLHLTFLQLLSFVDSQAPGLSPPFGSTQSVSTLGEWDSSNPSRSRVITRAVLEAKAKRLLLHPNTRTSQSRHIHLLLDHHLLTASAIVPPHSMHHLQGRHQAIKSNSYHPWVHRLDTTNTLHRRVPHLATESNALHPQALFQVTSTHLPIMTGL